MFRTLTQNVLFISLAFVGLVLASTVLGVANLFVIRDVTNHLGEQTLEQVELSGQFNTDMFRGIAAALTFARTHAPQSRNTALQEMRDAKTLLDQLATLEARPDTYAPNLNSDHSQLQSRRAATYASIQQKTVALIRVAEENDAAALTQMLDELSAHQSEVEQLEEVSSALADRSIVAATSAATTRIQVAFASAAICFMLSIVLVLTLLVFMRRWLVRPIQELAGVARGFTSGDLEQSVFVTSKGEIGDLQTAFATMAETMTATIRVQTLDLQRQVATATTAREEAEAARAALALQIAENDAQQAVIREMSVPILPLSTTTLIMPLIGVLDTARLHIVQEQALRAIKQSLANSLIMDITAVPMVDSQVAQGILQVIQAARLLGAEVVVVGVRPEVAQSLVGLGIHLGDMITRSSLQSGIDYTRDNEKARASKAPMVPSYSAGHPPPHASGVMPRQRFGCSGVAVIPL